MKNYYKNKRVLVTGGGGFIGSHLTERLVSQGAIVTVADDFSRGSTKNLYAIRKHIKILRCDLRTESSALAACHNQHIVFNLAALNTGVDYDKGKTHIMFEENALLQILPLRAAAQCHVQRFIQVSSASIYSTDAMVKRAPTKESDDQGSPEVSKLGYAHAKRVGEMLTYWYAHESSMHAVIARFINVYGERDNYDELGHFIPTITRKFILTNRTIEIFGSGNQKRSFLHVLDAVNALLLLGEKGKRGEAYNIDSHDEHSIRSVVIAIQKILGAQKIELHFNTSLPEGSKRRILDNTKILNLGWKPMHTLKEELPAVVRDITIRFRK